MKYVDLIIARAAFIMGCVFLWFNQDPMPIFSIAIYMLVNYRIQKTDE